MYTNLIIEMKRYHVSQKQIADLLGVREATISDKVRGVTKFYFKEAVLIKNTFFKGYDLEYLFETVEDIA